MNFTKKVEKVPGEKAYTYWENEDHSITISLAPRHLMGMENCKKYSAIGPDCEWNAIGWDTLEEAFAAF
jgi:hypothetical protein